MTADAGARKEQEMAIKDRLRRIKGIGTFRKKGNKIEYRVTFKDEFGRAQRKSFSADTEDICLDRADAFLERLEQRMLGLQPDVSIAEILERKVEYDYKKNYTGPQGYGRSMGTIKIIRKHGIGNMPIAEVDGAHLDDFLSYITRYSNTTISKIYSMLRLAYKTAMKDGIVGINYMDLREFRCPASSKPDKKVRGLTEEEQLKLIDALEDHKGKARTNTYKYQLLIELYGGLRMGEINALKPGDINFKKGFIHVHRTVARGSNYENFLKESPKTAAGVRDVPICNKLAEVLKQALSKMKNNEHGLIFYDYNKKDIVSTTQVNAFYRRICEKASIEYNGQHALRHTFASRCIEAGVPPIVLKNWMGHTDIHVTLDTYADVFNRMNLGAVEKLDEYIEKIYGD